MKAFRFKDSHPHKEFTGEWAIPVGNEWGSSTIPYLMSPTATLDAFKMLYPDISLDEVELISIEIIPEKQITELLEFVHHMRETGDTDLRTVLWAIENMDKLKKPKEGWQ